MRKANLFVFKCDHGKTCNFIADCSKCARDEIESLRQQLVKANAKVAELASINAKLVSDKYPFVHLMMDASEAEKEGALRSKMIELGWTPPSADLTARLESQEASEPVATLPFAILDDELDALRRFHECVTDGEGYDVPKEMMKRLAEIGLVRRVTGSIYEHTNFGLCVLDGEFTTPQPTPTVQAAVAAALRKAAEVCEGWETQAELYGFDGDAQEFRMVKQEILAIPHDDSALREICMRVAVEVFVESPLARKTLKTIVDRVIKGQ